MSTFYIVDSLFEFLCSSILQSDSLGNWIKLDASNLSDVNETVGEVLFNRRKVSWMKQREYLELRGTLYKIDRFRLAIFTSE